MGVPGFMGVPRFLPPSAALAQRTRVWSTAVATCMDELACMGGGGGGGGCPRKTGLSLLGAMAALIVFTCSTCSLLFLVNSGPKSAGAQLAKSLSCFARPSSGLASLFHCEILALAAPGLYQLLSGLPPC